MPLLDGQFDLDGILKALGLSERERHVYTAFLDGSSRPASLVSKQTGLKRGQTYDILLELEKKGIVQEFTKGNTRFFTASAPQGLLSLFENRERELAEQKSGIEQLAKHLEKNLSGEIRHPRVCYFHGQAGIKQIFEDMISERGSEIFLMVDSRYLAQEGSLEMANWIEGWIERRVRQEVWSYGIYSRAPFADTYLKAPGLLRKAKAITNVDFPIQIYVYRNKVALLSVLAELNGIVIEDQRCADTLRSLHQLLWNFLPDYFVQEPKEKNGHHHKSGLALANLESATTL